MKKQGYSIVLIIILLIVLFFVYQKSFIVQEHLLNKEQIIVSESLMEVKSAFNNSERIPVEFTCEGDNVSPPLFISGIPNSAKSLAIIADDPDSPSGTWVHWVIFNIIPRGDSMQIKEDESPGTEGVTSFKKIGYGGPCPPSGSHRYFFKVYALNEILNRKEGATKQQLEEAMQGHIIEKAELIGLYSRQ
jgi:Raf kinase inhibitor-like YbhB/YbcL family protein